MFNRLVSILLISNLIYGPALANHVQQHKSQKANISFQKRVQNQLERYQNDVVQALNVYKEKAAQIWGAETVVPSSNVDVTYRNQLKQRSVIDFEHGTLDVELAMKPDQLENVSAVTNQMNNAIKTTLSQGPDNRSIMEISEHPTPPANNNPSLLNGMVVGVNDNAINLIHLKNKRILNKRLLKGKDGKSRIIVSTQFKLVPNHIKIRALKFQPQIELNSNRHKIPSPWVYAIMETESFFNPLARSPVPAFGLMQLVPSSGARDAYRFLYSKDKLLKDTYLYNPDNNIELGVAYLHILYFRYFRSIENPKTRQWMTIAAYNTGAQNVFQSFVGKYSKSKHVGRWLWKYRALNQVNNMKPEQVYKHLLKHLPYKETRDYIKKVRERINKYKT